VALAVFSLVLAVKKVLDDRNRASEEEDREIAGLGGATATNGGVLKTSAGVSSASVGCERITAEEFEFQRDFNTKQEIRKLLATEEYQGAFEDTGSDPANWNWQLKDRQEGFLPKDEAELAAGAHDSNAAVPLDELDLEEELMKIDDGLRKEGVAVIKETGSRLADKLGKSLFKSTIKSPTGSR
jgi:hypothetical protein